MKLIQQIISGKAWATFLLQNLIYQVFFHSFFRISHFYNNHSEIVENMFSLSLHIHFKISIVPLWWISGHEESYNPSVEYIPTQEEIDSYQLMYEEDRPKFIPKRYYIRRASFFLSIVLHCLSILTFESFTSPDLSPFEVYLHMRKHWGKVLIDV